MSLQLAAQKREITGKKVAQLREQGLVPAVVYGPDQEPVNVTVERPIAQKMLEAAGNNTMIELVVEGDKSYDVLIHDIDRDPVTEFLRHMDFYAVQAGHKVQTEIPLNFVGEAPAVKALNGVLVTPIEAIAVSCLPKDLIQSIDVDLTALATEEDVVKVSDLTIPATLEHDYTGDEVVATVTVQKEEDLTSAPEAAMPEVEEKGKEEAEETAE